MANAKPSAPDAYSPTVVCVLTTPAMHHSEHPPGDCYCDVWCVHGLMECAECPGFTVEVSA